MTSSEAESAKTVSTELCSLRTPPTFFSVCQTGRLLSRPKLANRLLSSFCYLYRVLARVVCQAWSDCQSPMQLMNGRNTGLLSPAIKGCPLAATITKAPNVCKSSSPGNIGALRHGRGKA